jgi:hypothetical protein
MQIPDRLPVRARTRNRRFLESDYENDYENEYDIDYEHDYEHEHDLGGFGMLQGATRRELLKGTALAAAGLALGGQLKAEVTDGKPGAVPVVDITDLYHPSQDPGDNFDLIAAYGLPEVDLKAVVFDVTERYRRPYKNPDNPMYDDPAGRRDAGFVPVTQLNYIFDRNVPCAAAPFDAMKSPGDRMLEAPTFQSAGVELLLRALRESPVPVEVVSFGSARPAAVAFNREPDLMREKVKRIHLCAGSAPPGFLEWNVQLDVHGFVRLLRSDLPLAVYPCGGEKSAWDLAVNNCYWQLPDRSLIRRLHPRLQSYLAFAFERSMRMDFLCAMDEKVPEEVLQRICGGPHAVWETAVWTQVAGRKLVRRGNGTHRLVPAAEVTPADTPILEGVRPCRIEAGDDGQFRFEYTEGESNAAIYFREDPVAYQVALREALPALYESFTCRR